jgi:hypothetical protein
MSLLAPARKFLACRNAWRRAEVLELIEEALDKVAFAIEREVAGPLDLTVHPVTMRMSTRSLRTK